MGRIAIKRIYEPVADDGFRVLVDRVWPRGLSKERAAIDDWAREIAPSTELRKWFNHDPAKWEAFQERYRKELQEKSSELQDLLQKCGSRPMTLLFGARDTEHNQAIVLKEVLDHMR